MTFTEFLAETARKGEVVNILFEQRLFELVGVLHKITDALTEQDIPHELIGGLAVLIHVEEVNPEHAMLTRDVDLMVLRADLERIKEAAGKNGFRVSGTNTLAYGDSVRRTVRLILDGKDFISGAERKRFHGKEVAVAPIAKLVCMMLGSFRLMDRVLVRSMDAAGLITSEVENKLTPELRARLTHVRETE